jgi:hypothetical protein
VPFDGLLLCRSRDPLSTHSRIIAVPRGTPQDPTFLSSPVNLVPWGG